MRLVSLAVVLLWAPWAIALSFRPPEPPANEEEAQALAEFEQVHALWIGAFTQSLSEAGHPFLSVLAAGQQEDESAFLAELAHQMSTLTSLEDTALLAGLACQWVDEDSGSGLDLCRQSLWRWQHLQPESGYRALLASRLHHSENEPEALLLALEAAAVASDWRRSWAGSEAEGIELFRGILRQQPEPQWQGRPEVRRRGLTPSMGIAFISMWIDESIWEPVLQECDPLAEPPLAESLCEALLRKLWQYAEAPGALESLLDRVDGPELAIWLQRWMDELDELAESLHDDDGSPEGEQAQLALMGLLVRHGLSGPPGLRNPPRPEPPVRLQMLSWDEATLAPPQPATGMCGPEVPEALEGE